MSVWNRNGLGVGLTILLSLGACQPESLETERQRLPTQAEPGDAVLQYHRAVRYGTGDGVPKDESQALHGMRQSAEQGFAPAQYQLGSYYTLDRPSQDFTHAVYWLHQAARQGYPPAQDSLAMLYRLGLGVPRDGAQAYVWLNRAAAAGDPGALGHYDTVMESLSADEIERGRRLLDPDR